jgi:hypothetical protein
MLVDSLLKIIYIYITSCVNAVFTSRKINLSSNLDFGMSFDALFGSDYFKKYASISKRLDPNGILFTIKLFIIGFFE